ncbi:VOC family protein [Budvicia aquatica]|uniref:VOC family protein n=1 Tax=Budvicia aquatica TaxID=82979 RepID=A0A2C6DP46_9GAMM|nr:VOC family protein [Budvicia aquatica]PHI30215.1 VOC family protein [Budvicia aquatica]
MELQTYLFFDGNCEEALEFYQRSIGAEVTVMMRYKDSPDQSSGPIPDEWQNKIMHANITIGNSQFMASDGQCDHNLDHLGFHGFSLSLNVKDRAEAERLFKSLCAGGKISMPFQKTFWSSGFGTLTDRYGVGWMVMSDIES